MTYDAHKNFAYSTVATPPSPASSGTSLIVAAGEGSRFPAVSFNAVVWPAGANPLPTNAEVVRVTAGPPGSDTFTIARAQEGSSARAIVAGDQIANAITAKALTDIESVAGGVSVLGPFTVAYNDAGLTTDGSVVAALAAGTLVTGVFVVVDTAWDVLTSFDVMLGGSDYGPPNDDYGTILRLFDVQTITQSFSTGVGWLVAQPQFGNPQVTPSSYGYVSTAGALLAYAPAGAGATQGLARVWATVVTP